MAISNTIVDSVSRLDPPLQAPAANWVKAVPAGVTVHFAGGQNAQLDPSDPRSVPYGEILDELRQMNAPAYVEVDPATKTIHRLLIPLSVKVTAVTPSPSGEVEVDLEISHARHVLLAANPDYQHLLGELQNALAQGTSVLVTETDDHEIIDVRPAPNAPAAPSLGPAPPDVTLALRGVTPQRARQLFEHMSARSCNPRSVPPPCIPFLYPDDGCWGRAHEMCRLMIAEHEQPAKVWIYGRLNVKTRNNPTCQVFWGWHVAPTLQVTTPGGTQLQVIDPALFQAPVPEATWKGVQGDPGATLVQTAASIFYRSVGGTIETDPTYSKTNQVLATYRLQLKNRSASSSGPPPYSQCH